MANPDDIDVHDPTRREKQKRYDRSDVEHVMGVRDWSGWNEIENWLRREGDDDNELTPGETSHLADDFAQLAKRGVDFTRDPERVYAEINR